METTSHQLKQFPVVTKQFASLVQGEHTEFVLSSFSDHVFILVTQINKIGTMIKARKDLDIEGSSSYTIHTMLGKRDPNVEVYARRLIEITSSQGCPKPIIVSISLKKDNNDPQTFKQVISVIAENRVW